MSDFGFYLEELKRMQAEIELREKRETEQAETFASLRRGEFQDRTGFAGLVNVGDAVRRSDATVAEQVSGLADDDPFREVYDAALAAETENRAKQTRVITGEQFRADDAKAALEERLRTDLQPRELEALLSDYDDFIGEFEFFDDDDFIARAIKSNKENRVNRQAASDRLKAQAQNTRNRAKPKHVLRKLRKLF